MVHNARSNSSAIGLLLCLAIIVFSVSIDTQATDLQMVQLPFVLKGYPLPLSGQIAFVAGRDVDPEIFLMDYDGNNLIQLTDNSVADGAPDWSPDGSMIAYRSNLIDDVHEIYVMDANGANITRLTTIGGCESPKWSPDGLRIAFACYSQGYTLYVMDADGGNLLQLTQTYTDIQDLTWSPDSEQIAFASMFTSPEGVFVIDAQGGLPQLILEHEYVSGVAWSPDGRHLALTIMTTPSYTHDLFLYELDSEVLSRLTTTETNHFSPEWFPGGKYLVYQGYLDDHMTCYIYSISQDGTQLVQISAGGSDYAPDWTP